MAITDIIIRKGDNGELFLITYVIQSGAVIDCVPLAAARV